MRILLMGCRAVLLAVWLGLPSPSSASSASPAATASPGTPVEEGVAGESTAKQDTARPSDSTEPISTDEADGFESEPVDFEIPGLESRVRASRPVRPASEHVVDSKLIEAAPRTGATDLLRLVPGLVASKHGGEGKAHQLLLRGFDAVHGQDIEITAGGIPVNEVSHVHALGHADLNFLFPEAVREISVLEGTYRASQGDFAVAGTVDMRFGLARPGVLIAPTLGSFGLQRLVAGWAAEHDPETFAAVEGSRGHGFGPSRAHERLSGLAQARFDLGAVRLRLLAGSYGTRFDSPGAVREDAASGGGLDFFDVPVGGQGGDASRHQGLVEFTRPWVNGASSAATVWALRSHQKLRYNFTGFRFDPRGDGLDQRTETIAVGGGVTHRQPLELFDRSTVLELGIGVRHDAIDQAQSGYAEEDGSHYRDDLAARIGQTHVFGHAEATAVLGGWTLRLGGRADGLALHVVDTLTAPKRHGRPSEAHDRTTSGFRVGLKAGVSRSLGERWRAFVEYGDGFRTPQARSLSQGEPTPFVAVRGTELGARYDSRRLGFSASTFGSWLADDFFFDHAVGTTVRTGSTARLGVQATVAANPVSGLHFGAHATWAHAVMLETSTLLPYFAPLVGRADAGWEKPFRLFGVELHGYAGLGLTGVGPRPLRFGETGHGTVLADTRLSFGWGPVTLRLDVTNLFDSRWRDGEFAYASRFDEAAVALLPARHFTAGSPRALWTTLEIRP